MNINAIKTKKFIPQNENLNSLIDSIPVVENGSIVVISSKIISISNGDTIHIDSIDHEKLVKKLSSKMLEPKKRGKNGMVLTQVGDILVESAGVDMSNSNGHYVLLPKEPFEIAYKIWNEVRKRDKIKEVGIIISDSRSVPRRKGAIGFALASYGFIPVNEYKEGGDVFGEKFKFTASNIADGLAAAAVAEMGEGSEGTPIAIISKYRHAKFYKRKISIKQAKAFSWVHPYLDVYGPILSSKLWK